MGCLCERLLIQPLLAKPPHELLMGSILVTLGAALIASAGVAHVMLYSITPTMGIALTLKYLAIVVLVTRHRPRL